MTTPRRVSAVAGALLFAMTATACTGSASTTSAGGAKAGGSLTIGIPGAGSSLNPAKDGFGTQENMRSLAVQTITHIKPDGSFGPGLATSWRYVGTGNKEFEFTLRPGMRFSDGSPVTAVAVKNWLEYFARTNGPAASSIAVRSVQTAGKLTTRILLAQPNPDMPQWLSEQGNWGSVNGPKALADPAILDKQTDGVGPYILVPGQSVAGDHYTFLPNKVYYNKSAIKFSKVIVKIITKPSTMLAAVQSGQIDVAVGDVTTAPAAASAGLQVVTAVKGTDGLIFEDRGGRIAKPLRDVRVRQALNYAVDRKSITTALMGKYAEPTSEQLTGNGFDTTYQHYYSYDPTKARALLAAAGYASDFTVKVLDTGFAGNLGDPLTQAIAQNLRAIGVKLKITTAATQGQQISVVLTGTYPVIQLEAGASATASQYTQFLKPGGIIYPHGVADPVMDNLYRQGVTAKDPTPYWTKMSQRTVTTATFLPVFNDESIYYVSKKIGGFSVVTGSGLSFPATWSQT